MDYLRKKLLINIEKSKVILDTVGLNTPAWVTCSNNWVNICVTQINYLAKLKIINGFTVILD